MHAPSFHNVAFPSAGYHRWFESLRFHVQPLLHVAGVAWRGVQLFYGVAAIGIAAIGLAAYVAVDGDLSMASASRPAPLAAAVEVPLQPMYSSQVVYVVGSQRQADNLMAYGAGLPAHDPSNLLPMANVTVVVAATPSDEANVREAMQRIMSAHLGNSPTSIRMIDLR